MPIEKNKRNWRKQEVHLMGARAIQEIDDKVNGTNWREGNGRLLGSKDRKTRKNKGVVVSIWRKENPSGTISLRLNESDAKLIKEYTSANNLSVSSFIRNIVLDKIEDDLKLDEQIILNAMKSLDSEEIYDHTDVWKRLGV